MPKVLSFLLLFLICSSLISCKGSSTDPKPTATDSTQNIGGVPGVGSWYKFVIYERDTTGAVVSIDTEKDVIASTSFVMNGHKSAIHLTRTYSLSTDITDYYVYYDTTSGDMSLLDEHSAVELRFPFASKLPIISKLDTIYFVDSRQFHEIDSNAYVYQRDDKLDLSKSTIDCSVVSVTQTQRLASSVSGVPSSPTDFTTLSESWFSPKLRYVVYSKDITNIRTGARQELYESRLVDFQLK